MSLSLAFLPRSTRASFAPRGKQIDYERVIDKTMLEGDLRAGEAELKREHDTVQSELDRDHEMGKIDAKAMWGLKKLAREQFMKARELLLGDKFKRDKLAAETGIKQGRLGLDRDKLGLEQQKFGFDRAKFEKEHGIDLADLDLRGKEEARKMVESQAKVDQTEANIKQIENELNNENLTDSDKLRLQHEQKTQEQLRDHAQEKLMEGIKQEGRERIQRLKNMGEKLKKENEGKLSDTDKKLFDRKVTPLAKRFEEDVKNTISDACLLYTSPSPRDS